jgi:hypothetical protein
MLRPADARVKEPATDFTKDSVVARYGKIPARPNQGHDDERFDRVAGSLRHPRPTAAEAKLEPSHHPDAAPDPAAAPVTLRIGL